MPQTANILASGQGWRVTDILCTAAAGDRPFEEAHADFCIAAVTRGTFRYRARQGTAVMAPGALLLGNAGTCFECGHEHGSGDRCLSFHFTPAYLEDILADTPGARRLGFDVPRLPPLEVLAPLLADAEAACVEHDRCALEEIGLRLAGAAIMLAADARPSRKPTRRDEQRVATAIRLIENEAERPITLTELASSTATSSYHFLRIFRDIAGMTPHQFVLKTRLHRAALKLRHTEEPVSTVAYDAGFNDLSTFNRRFRRVMGEAPATYRARTASGNCK